MLPGPDGADYFAGGIDIGAANEHCLTDVVCRCLIALDLERCGQVLVSCQDKANI